MHEETVGCNTTDTVTQEWMEAFDARIAENVKRAVYDSIAEGNVTVGEWKQSEPYGIFREIDGKQVFTPFIFVHEPVFPADVKTKHIEL